MKPAFYFLCSLTISACGNPSLPEQRSSSIQEAFGPKENPWSIESLMPRHFDASLLSARLSRAPWVDSYYPTTFGSIAARYFSLSQPAWEFDSDALRPLLRNYSPVTHTEALGLGPSALRALSAAEKYELYAGAKGLTAKILSSSFASSPSWAGLCHGWAPASLNFSEPKPVTVQKNGLSIPFASSDIKALLMYYQGEIARLRRPPKGGFIGRCNIMGICEAPLNPGALHVVLAHMIGRRDHGLILDLGVGAEKWNFPVFAYQAEIVPQYSPAPQAGVARQIPIRNTLTYAVEAWPQWEPYGDDPELHESLTLCYTLEVDSGGQVKGGRWVSDFPGDWGADCNTTLPEFAWFKEKPAFANDEWGPLADLLAAAGAR